MRDEFDEPQPAIDGAEAGTAEVEMAQAETAEVETTQAETAQIEATEAPVSALSVVLPALPSAWLRFDFRVG